MRKAIGFAVIVLCFVVCAMAQQTVLPRDIYVDTDATGDFLRVDSSSPKELEVIAPTAEMIGIAEIGTATWDTVQDFILTFGHSGWISGGAITDNLDGTIDVAAGTGYIRSADSETVALYSFDWPASAGVVLVDDDGNYIYVDYNGGAPVIAATIAGSTIRDNENDKFEIAEVWRDGNDLHITPHKQIAGAALRLVQQKYYSIARIERADAEGGLIIGEAGARNPTMTAGTVWIKLDPIAIGAVDCSGADTFTRYYRDGGVGWTAQLLQTQWDNTQYDNGSGALQTMTNNRYSFQEFYIESDGHMVSIYGQDQYVTLVQAEEAPVITGIPEYLEDHALFLGRITFQKSDVAAQSILSAFVTDLVHASVSDHGNLSGLADDDHAQYALLAGRAAGQTLIGDTASGGDLKLQSTTHINKGSIFFGLAGTSAFDEVNGRLGIGTAAPGERLHIYNGAGGGGTPTANRDLIVMENNSNAYINVITGTSNEGGILFSDNTRARGSVTYSHSQDSMKFVIASAEQARFDNSGLFGINTITGGYRLTVLDAANPQLSLEHTAGAVLTTFQTDANGYCTIDPTGALVYVDGHIVIKSGAELRFNDVGNSNHVGFEAPALTADQIWVLPDADGAAGHPLITDGAGNLAFTGNVDLGTDTFQTGADCEEFFTASGVFDALSSGASYTVTISTAGYVQIDFSAAGSVTINFSIPLRYKRMGVVVKLRSFTIYYSDVNANTYIDEHKLLGYDVTDRSTTTINTTDWDTDLTAGTSDAYSDMPHTMVANEALMTTIKVTNDVIGAAGPIYINGFGATYDTD